MGIEARPGRASGGGTRPVSFHIRRREWPRGSSSRLQEKKGGEEEEGR